VRFPEVMWIAVMLWNRAEHMGKSTFEESRKSSAIFRGSEVFDRSNALPGVIESEINRQPFKYEERGNPAHVGWSWKSMLRNDFSLAIIPTPFE
jgi:hypothetical protein